MSSLGASSARPKTASSTALAATSSVTIMVASFSAGPIHVTAWKAATAVGWTAINVFTACLARNGLRRPAHSSRSSAAALALRATSIQRSAVWPEQVVMRLPDPAVTATAAGAGG
jgi:hypothetical protein